MRHEPRRLEGNPKSAVQLVARNALLGRTNQMDRHKPVTHGDMAGLENGPDFDAERLTAGIALPKPNPIGLAFQGSRLPHNATVRAYTPARPHSRLNVGIGSGFIIEMRRGKDRLGHG